MPLTCFKTYDIRGTLGENIDEDIALRIGRAFAKVLDAGSVVLGRDVRKSSPALHKAVAEGLMLEGVDVLDIGHCGTEEVYFATDHLNADGGLMVTASHNPKSDNGIKMVGRGARPIPENGGFSAMHDIAAANAFAEGRGPPGRLQGVDVRDAYADRVLSFIEPASLLPMKVLVNAGNGSAGPTFDVIAQKLLTAGAPISFVTINHEPNGDFPKGVPNPLLPENRPGTADAVRANSADLGIAWDGDFDRCFFFDEHGAFVDGEYVVALIAAAILAKSPGETVVHDPRVVWNTMEVVSKNGGRTVASRTGHAFVKETMRAHDAVYGGEMSAHHYFRDFMYCDSGMIPWLLLLSHMSRTRCALSELVSDMRRAHPSSGELNFRVANPDRAISDIEQRYRAASIDIDRLDGLSMAFPDWRFNLRRSNTEALLRLNVESRGDRELLAEKTRELSAVIDKA